VTSSLKKQIRKLVPPPKKSARSVTNAVLNDVLMERSRQDEKWGEQNHPDLCPVLMGREGGASPQCFAEDLEIPTRSRAQFLCQQRFARKQGTWASIAVEELCEAVESAARQTQPELRKELVQLAAVCVAWIEALDRRPK
jgi:hypothetical protein